MEMGVLKRGKALRLLQTAILLPGDICEAIPSNSEFAAREQLTIVASFSEAKTAKNPEIDRVGRAADSPRPFFR